MKLLIDECLSPRLAAIAHERGYAATAVRDLGQCGTKDWDLLARIEAEEWTLVTNNVEEFRDRYREKLALHAGLVSLKDVHAGREHQQAAFAVALDEIEADADLTNTEVLVQRDKAGKYFAKRIALP